VNSFLSESPEFTAGRPKRGVASEILLDFTLEAFSTELFVSNTVLFPLQIGAKQAVRAARKVLGKPAVAAVFTVQQVSRAIAVANIKAFVAEFRVIAVGAVDTVCRALKQLAVITVLTVLGGIN